MSGSAISPASSIKQPQAAAQASSSLSHPQPMVPAIEVHVPLAMVPTPPTPAASYPPSPTPSSPTLPSSPLPAATTGVLPNAAPVPTQQLPQQMEHLELDELSTAARPESAVFPEEDEHSAPLPPQPKPSPPRAERALKHAHTRSSFLPKSRGGDHAPVGFKAPASMGSPEMTKNISVWEEDEEDAVSAKLTTAEVRAAAEYEVIDKDGRPVRLGDLLPETEEPEDEKMHGSAPLGPSTTRSTAARSATRLPREPGPLKTVLLFIRFFWCGQCQDYMMASVAKLDKEALAAARVRVVVIGNGSWRIIKRYKQIMGCEDVEVYVDPGPHNLYKWFGLTKYTKMGDPPKGFEKPEYHVHSFLYQTVVGVGKGIFKMPLANPGPMTQLGGEFVMGPGYKCEWAHRMTHKFDHVEAADVVRLAGVANPLRADALDGPGPLCETSSTGSERSRAIAALEKEMHEWRVKREAVMEKIRARRAKKLAAKKAKGLAASNEGSEASLPLEGDGRPRRVSAEEFDLEHDRDGAYSDDDDDASGVRTPQHYPAAHGEGLPPPHTPKGRVRRTRSGNTIGAGVMASPHTPHSTHSAHSVHSVGQAF